MYAWQTPKNTARRKAERDGYKYQSGHGTDKEAAKAKAAEIRRSGAMARVVRTLSRGAGIRLSRGHVVINETYCVYAKAKSD